MFCHGVPRCRPSPSFRPERPLCRGVACPEPVEGEESRRRLPVLALEVEPGSLRSLRSVGMTVGKWGGGSENCVCHEMSCFVMLGHDSPRWPPCSLSAAAPSSPFPCAVRTRQTILSNTFFCTRLSVSKPRRRTGSPQTAGRRRPQKRFCSYNVPVRASSSFLRRLRLLAASPSGFRLAGSSAKGARPRAPGTGPIQRKPGRRDRQDPEFGFRVEIKGVAQPARQVTQAIPASRHRAFRRSISGRARACAP